MMYYRRYTRMYLPAAFKYFSKYGVLDYHFEKFTPLLAHQNPDQELYRPKKDIKKLKQKDMDTKLINKLFLKYPDLKYEPISHQKYHGKQLNTFSYAYSFLTEQKKLINKGYTIDKAFQMVEAKYQQKMQRKLDQTLISRKLAIGNRARSILSIYQQQSEYESRLKVARTKRQLQKYEMKEKAVKQRVQGEQDETQDNDGLLDEKTLNYQRIIQKVVKKAELDLQEKVVQNQEQNRSQKIRELQNNFKQLFKQFYERVEAKDLLFGLTDEQLIQSIKESPNRTRRQTKQLLKYLKSLNADIKLVNGEVKVEGEIRQDLKKFIENSPGVKKALLNERLNWERPNNYQSVNITKDQAKIKEILSHKKKLKDLKPDHLSKEDLSAIKQNKIKAYQLIASDQIPQTRDAYKIFESEEQRILRLQIKYYDLLSSEIMLDKLKVENQEQKQKMDHELNIILKNRQRTIQKFRRLKYRLQTRYRKLSRQDLLFPEHETIIDQIDLEKKGEYENLLKYLRKKSEDRRLTILEQSNDNRINQYLEKVFVQEDPDYVGSENKREY